MIEGEVTKKIQPGKKKSKKEREEMDVSENFYSEIGTVLT